MGSQFPVMDMENSTIAPRPMQPADISATAKRIDWQQPSVIALVAANLVPLVGVFVFRWEVFPLLFLFWLENIVVGVSNVLKMLFAAPRDVARWAAKLFVIPFFCVHYGGFTFVHGVLVIAFFGGGLKDQRGLFLSVDTLCKLVTQNHLEWAPWPGGQSRNLFRAQLSLARRIPSGKTAGADESTLCPCRCAAPDDSRWRVSHVGAAFAGGGIGGAGAAE